MLGGPQGRRASSTPGSVNALIDPGVTTQLMPIDSTKPVSYLLIVDSAKVDACNAHTDMHSDIGILVVGVMSGIHLSAVRNNTQPTMHTDIEVEGLPGIIVCY